MDFTKFDEGNDSFDDEEDDADEVNGAEEEQMALDQNADNDNLVDEEGDGGGDEDDDEEEDDSDDGNEEEAILVAEINRLQEELSYNPVDYDKHVALISKLKSVGDLELIREAREKMDKLFPLSTQLWTDWIVDETELASTSEEKMAVIALYDRAVSEYLDSKIWSNYVQYSVELSEDNLLSAEDVRKLFDRALSHVGCSVAGGSLFWRYYRLLESNSISEESTEEQIKQQVKTTFDLFQRQFSVPLLEMEVDYLQFEQWLEQIKESYDIDLDEFKQEIANVKSEYEKSLKVLQSLVPYETALQKSEHPHLEEYLKYLEVEIKNDNLARTQCLFERAITDNCLNGDLWLKYLKYCDSKFVVDKLLLPVYQRAIRNCPWVADIWVQYMLAREALSQHENFETLESEMCSILEQAMKNTFSSLDDYKKLWLTYFNFIRRNACRLNSWNDDEQMKSVRETFESIATNLESMSNLEYCFDLYRYFAKIEAKYCKNMANARKIYNDLLNRSADLKRQAAFWLEFANLELLYGQEDEYRKILYKGLNMCSDYPESIGDALLRFEQEDGRTVEQYRISAAKYETALKRVNERRAKEAGKAESAASAERPQPGNALKRKVDGDDAIKKKNHIEPKKKRVNEPSPAFHGVSGVKTDDAKREQTIFVSNLVFDVDEDEIRKAFLQFGPINEVRLVRDYKGRSKGYCYVEFEKIESSRKSLLHDRMLLRGRPVFINEIDKRTTFSYSTNKEKNKLFVKNIPFDVTKEDLLSKVFADYADSVVDVRLVTFRNGHSKGIAYVEMKNADIAEKAVKDKNDFEIGDRKLFVAISDPSLSNASRPGPLSGKGPARAPSSAASSLMIPHALMAKSHPSKVKMQLDDDFKHPDILGDSPANSGDASKPAAKNLSNDQFRSMFLN